MSESVKKKSDHEFDMKTVKERPAREIVAENLQRIFNVSGFRSRPHFTDKTGIASATFARMIRGDVDSSIASVQQVANALGKECWELFVDNADRLNEMEDMYEQLNPTGKITFVKSLIDDLPDDALAELNMYLFAKRR